MLAASCQQYPDKDPTMGEEGALLFFVSCLEEVPTSWEQMLFACFGL